MSHEIERKFLLLEPLNAVLKRYDQIKYIVIEQRYLNSGEWTAHTRRTVQKGSGQHRLSLKKNVTDVSCLELETKVDAAFHDLMDIHCGPSLRGWTTRIRQTICDGRVEHWLTLKKKVTDVSCIELETKVDAAFYSLMVSQCSPPLRKVRHEVVHDGHCWEIDLFLDPIFDGLVIAEIELDSESETFVKPDWIGREVTDDKQYKNARMVRRLTNG